MIAGKEIVKRIKTQLDILDIKKIKFAEIIGSTPDVNTAAKYKRIENFYKNLEKDGKIDMKRINAVANFLRVTPEYLLLGNNHDSQSMTQDNNSGNQINQRDNEGEVSIITGSKTAPNLTSVLNDARKLSDQDREDLVTLLQKK